MTDEYKTILELAAKAAGYVLPSADDHDEIGRQYDYQLGLWVKFPWGWDWFRPHIDDGQSLRLAVKLELNVTNGVNSSGESVAMVSHANNFGGRFEVPHGADPYAATRRAIVRAASSIGEKL